MPVPTLDSPQHLDQIYSRRFSDADAMRKDAIWQEIAGYLQRFVDPGAAVVDIACDRGDFIRNIRAREKWGTDLRDVSAHLDGDVRFVQADGLGLRAPRRPLRCPSVGSLTRRAAGP
jgi:hypothetical protein